MIEGFRSMSPAEKLQRVAALNRALIELSTARLRAQYGPHLTQRELGLRLAALRLDAETMRKAFKWDPAIHGL
jgi:hypothetical protein